MNGLKKCNDRLRNENIRLKDERNELMAVLEEKNIDVKNINIESKNSIRNWTDDVFT